MKHIYYGKGMKVEVEMLCGIGEKECKGDCNACENGKAEMKIEDFLKLAKKADCIYANPRD